MTSPNVGIIGAGRIGQAMARTALRAGRTVVISNSRGPQTLTSVAKTLGDGVSAGTVKACVGSHDRRARRALGNVRDAVQGLEWNGDDLDAKAEVMALFEDAGFDAIDLGGLVSGGVMQQRHGPLAGVNLIRL